jgi:hypothetical protein
MQRAFFGNPTTDHADDGGHGGERRGARQRRQRVAVAEKQQATSLFALSFFSCHYFTIQVDHEVSGTTLRQHTLPK